MDRVLGEKKYDCNECSRQLTGFCEDCLVSPGKMPTNFMRKKIPAMDTLPVIERPEHYERNGIDVLDFADMQFTKEENKGFYRINILKYVTRYDRKNGIDDLKKAADYLKMLIELEEQ